MVPTMSGCACLHKRGLSAQQGACAPVTQGYPLRPELMESTFLLHAATRDARLLRAGRALQATLVERNRARCGYASVADVATGAHALERYAPTAAQSCTWAIIC